MPANTQKGRPIDRTYDQVMQWQPGQVVPFDLDCNSLVEELDVTLTGTATLAGYTADPTIRAEGLEQLIRLITLVGNSKNSGNTTVDFSATDAAYLRMKTLMMNQGNAPTRINVGNANGVYNFQTGFSKYFGTKRINGAWDISYLDTRTLQALVMNFSCGDVTCLVKPGTGANGATTLTNVQATIHSVEWVGGALVTKAPYIIEKQRKFDLTNVSGLNNDFLNVPVGNTILRQYFKGTVGDVDFADPSDAFFTTNLRQSGAQVNTFVNGNINVLNATYSKLQGLDAKKFGLTPWPTGYAVAEYSRTGSLGEALNLTGATSCKNTLDITPVAGQTNTLQITDEQYVAG